MLRRRSILDQHQLTEREQKSFQLLELLRQRGAMTRTELSQGTGFNVVTVSNYINQFIKTGLVSERGYDISTGGRKPVLVELNAKSGYVIGIDLGQRDLLKDHTISVITDLQGKIVHRMIKPRTMDSLEQILKGSGEIVRELLASSPVDPSKIYGVGIGLPGIIDERAGTVRNASRYAVRTNFVTYRDQLEAEFNLPMLMGNDATLAGYGELCLGLNRPIQNMVYCYSDIGMGLILNGHIYWGSGGSAGEAGVFVSSDEDYLTWLKGPIFCRPSSGDLGLIETARKLVREGHPSTIGQLSDNNPDSIDLELVVKAAQSHDPLARELIEHSAVQLGIRIADLVNLLNPEIIILGGGIERAGSLMLEPVWRSVKKYAFEEPGSLVDVLPAQLGENAVALGAACWVIREVFVQS